MRSPRVLFSLVLLAAALPARAELPAFAVPTAQALLEGLRSAESSAVSGFEHAPGRVRLAPERVPQVSAPVAELSARQALAAEDSGGIGAKLGGIAKNLLAPLRWPFRKPGKDRDWTDVHKHAPRITFDGDRVSIEHVRNFRWGASPTRAWDTRSYDLSEVESAWFIVSPFGATGAMAHTYVSFGFKDGRYLALSVEARREKGEDYSPWRGVWGQYELTYVIADELDAVALRTHDYKDPTYLYRVKATPEKAREFLRGLLERAEKLRAEPEFYNTFTQSCTSELVDQLNRVAPRKASNLDPRALLPGFSDKLAWDLGLLEGESFEAAKKAAYINDKALAAPLDENWSRAIRN